MKTANNFVVQNVLKSSVASISSLSGRTDPLCRWEKGPEGQRSLQQSVSRQKPVLRKRPLTARLLTHEGTREWFSLPAFAVSFLENRCRYSPAVLEEKQRPHPCFLLFCIFNLNKSIWHPAGFISDQMLSHLVKHLSTYVPERRTVG